MGVYRRLLETATEIEVHKYIAEAYRLRARIAVAENDHEKAVSEFGAALDELKRYPAPLVTWRTYSDLGRLEQSRGNADAAQAAFLNAQQIVEMCAANVTDEKLKATFLNSDAVKQVMAGAGQ